MWRNFRCQEGQTKPKKMKRTKNDTFFSNPISLLWTEQKTNQIFLLLSRAKPSQAKQWRWRETQISESISIHVCGIFFLVVTFWIDVERKCAKKKQKYMKIEIKNIKNDTHSLASDVQWKCYVPGNFQNWFFLRFFYLFCCVHYKQNMCK